jgi:hypothetical protein
VDWKSAFTIGAAGFVTAVLIIRGEPRIRRGIFLILGLPFIVLVLRWSAYRNAWDVLLAGIGLMLTGVALWWLSIGRRLPPARGSQIRVWEEDAPSE